MFYLPGMTDEEMAELADFDSVEADNVLKMTVKGDDVEVENCLRGESVFTEKFKLGVEREVQFGSIVGSVSTIAVFSIFRCRYARIRPT